MYISVVNKHESHRYRCNEIFLTILCCFFFYFFQFFVVSVWSEIGIIIFFLFTCSGIQCVCVCARSLFSTLFSFGSFVRSSFTVLFTIPLRFSFFYSFFFFFVQFFFSISVSDGSQNWESFSAHNNIYQDFHSLFFAIFSSSSFTCSPISFSTVAYFLERFTGLFRLCLHFYIGITRVDKCIYSPEFFFVFFLFCSFFLHLWPRPMTIINTLLYCIALYLGSLSISQQTARWK